MSSADAFSASLLYVTLFQNGSIASDIISSAPSPRFDSANDTPLIIFRPALLAESFVNTLERVFSRPVFDIAPPTIFSTGENRLSVATSVSPESVEYIEALSSVAPSSNAFLSAAPFAESPRAVFPTPSLPVARLVSIVGAILPRFVPKSYAAFPTPVSGISFSSALKSGANFEPFTR